MNSNIEEKITTLEKSVKQLNQPEDDELNYGEQLKLYQESMKMVESLEKDLDAITDEVKKVGEVEPTFPKDVVEGDVTEQLDELHQINDKFDFENMTLKDALALYRRSTHLAHSIKEKVVGQRNVQTLE